MSVRLKPSPQLSTDGDLAERLGGSPQIGRKGQFATIALAKTRNRRPSTVKLFANSANPFADLGGSGSPSNGPGADGSPFSQGNPKPEPMPLRISQRDDSTLRSKKTLRHAEAVDEDEFDGTTGGGGDGLMDGKSFEAMILSQYRSREPTFKKEWSAQQPFRFGSASDVALANQGLPMRSSEAGRLNPLEWEEKVASYNDWELGMLHKLALAAALLLSPEDPSVSSKSLDERLDEIARGDSAVRAEPKLPPGPKPRVRSLGESQDEGRDTLPERAESPTNAGSATRSPELTRKQKYGSWSAKVAAAKKKSWERKKGADTITQLRQEEGLEAIEKDPGADNSLFTIWNRDGASTPSASPSSAVSTPTGSPAVKRKDYQSPEAVLAGSSSGRNTPTITRKNRFSSIRGKRMSVQLGKTSLDEGEAASTEAFPGLSMRSADVKEFLELKKAHEQKEQERVSPEAAAFPGLSLRSADAKAFEALLKADQEKKGLRESGSLPLASSPARSAGVSPRSPVPAESAPTTPVPVSPTASTGGGSPTSISPDEGVAKRPPSAGEDPAAAKRSITPAGSAAPPVGKADLGLKLGFLTAGRRASGREGPTSTVVEIPKDASQKSPKGKRFSTVFNRKDSGSPMLSPKSAAIEQGTVAAAIPARSSTPGTPQSPRLRTSGSTRSSKSPSPRTSQGLKLGGFSQRRKSPRPDEPAPVIPPVASPPLSARELTADASTLAALDDLLGDDVSPRPDE